ncbi:MAG: hypothetical protein JRI76_02535, partial [Deltaproteobacteria bacterium]|nr:hypothetical protein [Deltaproteobacteria bacterium]
FLIPGCVMVVLTSWKFVANSWAIVEGSPDPGGIPFRFVLNWKASRPFPTARWKREAGRHRRHGVLADVTMGSTSRRVLRRSKKPVLIVRLPESGG